MAAGIDYSLVVFVDAVCQIVLAEMLPNVFLWVEFEGIGRQVKQADVVGNAELSSGLMPSSAIEHDYGAAPGRDLPADFLKV